MGKHLQTRQDEEKNINVSYGKEATNIMIIDLNILASYDTRIPRCHYVKQSLLLIYLSFSKDRAQFMNTIHVQ